MKAEYLARMRDEAALVENYLENCFVYPGEPQQKLFEAMRYSLLAGGKRLRPILTLEFCRACGGVAEAALPFAAALEMVHTYSLIHDDLPCMDDDDFRRGRPTCHRVYGEANAVLAGDALLTAAFTRLSMAPYPPERIVLAVQMLGECAGELGMVGGQVLDLEGEDKVLSEDEIGAIHVRKTGALIGAACTLGVIAAGGTDAQLDAAAKYAAGLGLAFQIRDDMLDVIGDAEKLGKQTGMDEHKNTYARLLSLEECRRRVDRLTDYAVSALDAFDGADFLRELAYWLISRDH
jgi:geranylgeranyl diphosphate synthase type II